MCYGHSIGIKFPYRDGLVCFRIGCSLTAFLNAHGNVPLFKLTFLVTMFSFGSLKLNVQQEYAQNSWFYFGLYLVIKVTKKYTALMYHITIEFLKNNVFSEICYQFNIYQTNCFNC